MNPVSGLKKVIMVVFLHRKYKIIFINYYSYRNYIFY
jgi:hypothetical protein